MSFNFEDVSSTSGSTCGDRDIDSDVASTVSDVETVVSDANANWRPGMANQASASFAGFGAALDTTLTGFDTRLGTLEQNVAAVINVISYFMRTPRHVQDSLTITPVSVAPVNHDGPTTPEEDIADLRRQIRRHEVDNSIAHITETILKMFAQEAITNAADAIIPTAVQAYLPAAVQAAVQAAVEATVPGSIDAGVNTVLLDAVAEAVQEALRPYTRILSQVDGSNVADMNPTTFAQMSSLDLQQPPKIELSTEPDTDNGIPAKESDFEDATRSDSPPVRRFSGAPSLISSPKTKTRRVSPVPVSSTVKSPAFGLFPRDLPTVKIPGQGNDGLDAKLTVSALHSAELIAHSTGSSSSDSDNWSYSKLNLASKSRTNAGTRPMTEYNCSYFLYGLLYEPIQGDQNVFRTVSITNLPARITLSQVLKKVRGGPIFSAVLLDTVSTIGNFSALVTFVYERGSLAYTGYSVINDVSFEGRSAVIKLVRTPTYPMSLDLQDGINLSDYTRCLEISKFPSTEVSEAKLRKHLHPYKSGISGVVSVKLRANNVLAINFSSIAEAAQARSLFKEKVYSKCVVKFVPDPCARPVSELGLHRKKRFTIEVHPRVGNSAAGEKSVAMDNLMSTDKTVTNGNSVIGESKTLSDTDEEGSVDTVIYEAPEAKATEKKVEDSGLFAERHRKVVQFIKEYGRDETALARIDEDSKGEKKTVGKDKSDDNQDDKKEQVGRSRTNSVLSIDLLTF